MLMKLKFRFPDVALGGLLAVALFLLGMAFSGSYRQANDNGPSNNHTETNQKNMAADERLADYTLALDALTFVLVAATIGLGIVTYVGIRNQTRDTRILQRAYLSTRPALLHEMSDGSVVAHVAFINGGNLPARHVRNGVKIELSGDGEKNDFENVNIEEGQILIAPKEGIERGTSSLSQEGVEACDKRLDGFYVYVWGRIEYDDGFGNARWMIYCHRYNCSSPDTPRIHHHHNDGN
jgi:hypothetical protein